MPEEQTFILPGPLHTAVLFLIYKRPDTTKQVFEAIRQAKPPRLYVAADGPKADVPGEAEKVQQARDIVLNGVDWDCEVKTRFRGSNLGCKYGVSGGIDWFFENEEEGIILEDDTLPSQSFFWFCEEILNQYENDARVMSICGTNITNGIVFKDSYFFSIYPLMWGWATWRHSWIKYDLELKRWPSYKADGLLGECLGLNGIEENLWARILDRTYSNGIDTWDYQWIYSCWVNNGMTVAPSINLVRNIGYCEDATHTKGSHPILSNLVEREMSFPLKHPNQYEIKREADRFISHHWFGASWRGHLKSRIFSIPGLHQLNSIRKKLKAI